MFQNQFHQLQLAFLIIQSENLLTQWSQGNYPLFIIRVLLKQAKVSSRIKVIIGLTGFKIHEFRDLKPCHRIFIQIFQKGDNPVHGIGLDERNIRIIHIIIRSERCMISDLPQIFSGNLRILQRIILDLTNSMEE